MQLDKFTDYALRILMTLAVRAPARVATSEIATLFGLSENHLSKVSTQLVREGFVLSERGRNGGLTLARAPERILVGAVVRTMTRKAHVVECFGTDKSCLILPSCGLRQPLAEAQEAFFATLDHYTLADVTRSRHGLGALLNPQFANT
ncbi:Rrf2 family transcriptional regulator [Roseobacter denitrificans]|uniref:Transcriptional regulator, putative n=1 Tax=Roseobacter denitrificans (strain ATCC 33942 / OCh 114) TaxID=375451 RepID=Q169M8_ROSDO|nr:Rrf2 family transcriptional regulator [Roseobacter denitrificans]ABG31315.1 transcriptional regulator, putative [Roseobacter denitrificans OCh 114]AVL54351.1 Rrf2 family transcriptional regulator [Roseobacter denitrificans]SFF99406.1 transcriptional regulator, BadM/Rrf2 family [Roseobacter denitrificans OCh 114]